MSATSRLFDKTLNAVDGVHNAKINQSNNSLISDGKTEYSVLLGCAPDKVISFALNELLDFFKAASGINLTVVADCDYVKGNKYISLGNTKLVKDSGIELSSKTLGSCGYVVKSYKDSIILTGAYSYGTLYSVYEFLSVYFNFEVFSYNTIRLDKNVTQLKLLDLDIMEVPDFQYRSPSHAYIKYNETLKNRFRMMNLEELLDGEGGPYHNNFNFIPPKVYKAQHPKWFSDDGWQMCYTAHGDDKELELLKAEVTKKIIGFIIKNPEVKYIAFNHQDNQEWCDCDACKAVKAKYDNVNSAIAARFLNAIRAQIQKWFDTDEGKSYDFNQKLVFFAYHGTNKPPVRIDSVKQEYSLIDDEVVLKGVVPWFAETNGDYVVPLTQGDINAPIADNLRGWKLLSDEILFWTYGTNFDNYLAPYNSFPGTQATYKFAKEQKAGLIFDECQINTKASTGWEELKGFLNYKLAWNCDVDTLDLTNQYFEASYGVAAEHMRKIFDEYLILGLEQNKNGYNGTRSIFIDPIDKKYWSKQQLYRWKTLAEQAEKAIEYLVDTDKDAYDNFRRNILLEKLSIVYLLAEVFVDELDSMELKQLRTSFTSYVALTGLNMFNEKKDISVLLNKWFKD